MGTVPSETIPARYVATSLGMVVGLGEVLGGVGAPAIAGRAADHYGLQAPVIIMAVCAVVGTVLALFLRETAPIRLPRQSRREKRTRRTIHAPPERRVPGSYPAVARNRNRVGGRRPDRSIRDRAHSKTRAPGIPSSVAFDSAESKEVPAESRRCGRYPTAGRSR